jgi:hypothetical protein
MKAILIDPITETIQELDVVNDHSASRKLAEHLRDEHGNPPPSWEPGRLDEHNSIICDDTAQMTPERIAEAKHIFSLAGEFYVGRAVITGYYYNEPTGDTTLTVKDVKAMVKFKEAAAMWRWGARNPEPEILAGEDVSKYLASRRG